MNNDLSHPDSPAADCEATPGLNGTDFARLAAMIGSLAGATQLQEVTAAVTTAVRPLVGADGVTFILREGDQCFYADEDAISPLWKGLRFPSNTCLSGWCMAHGEAVVIEDIGQDPRVPAAVYRPTFVRSVAMVPVKVGAPVAAVGAYWAVRRRATAREIAILEMIANLAAFALDRLSDGGTRRDAQSSEAHQRVLIGEISHRVKNTLAVVQAMAVQTARNAPTIEAFRDTFLARLGALGSAHGLLVQEDWKDVPLSDLVAATLHHVAQPGAQVTMRGADIRLNPRAHLSMAMALHELAINAVRHGALARPGGSLHIHWRKEQSGADGGGCALFFTWEESGAGTGHGPLLPGFGLTLVNRLIRHDLHGDCTLVRLPPRLAWQLSIPCAELVSPADAWKPKIEQGH